MLSSLVRYLAFVAVSLVGPGIALQRLVRVAVDATLVMPLGCAATAGVYWLAGRFGAPWLFPIVMAALDVSLLWRGLGQRAPDDPPLRGAIPAGLGLVVFLALSQYGWNRSGPGGEFHLDPMGDHPLHAGITWELTGSWPPQVPGVAGVPLVYHIGADLVRAAALRWADVSPYDAINRFEVTLSALALALALRGVTARLSPTPFALAAVPWSLLATDGSFLLALALPLAWWTDLLRGNMLMSMAFDNPVVLGMTLALGALVALARYEVGEGRGFLVLCGILAASVPQFKVFVGAQLALALGWAALRGRPRWPRLLPCALSLGSSVMLVHAVRGELVEIAWAPLDMVKRSIVGLGLPQPGLGAVVAWTLPWLVLSLGLRIFGLSRAVTALGSRAALPSALAAFALSGWPLGLLFHAAARGVDGQPLPSALIYLLEQSGSVLWVFTALALADVSRRRPRPVLVALMASALTLPATVEFLWRRWEMRPDDLSPALVRGIRTLAEHGRPGDVVLQRPGWERPALPVILAGRRVVLEGFTPYLTEFAPASELRRRRRLLRELFRAESAQAARALSEELGASFLCLYGRQSLAFDTTGWLRMLYEHEEIRVYRIGDEVGARLAGEGDGGPRSAERGADDVAPDEPGEEGVEGRAQEEGEDLE
jgi:hypothetical protein